MTNPFNFLQFATGERFHDRVEIRRDLKARFLSGPCNVILHGAEGAVDRGRARTDA